MTRQTTCWDGAGRLLQRNLLVITVDRLLRIEREWTLGLAVLAKRDLDFDVGVLRVRTESCTAFYAVEFDIFELWEHAASTGNDATNSHKAIEMALT